MIYPQLDNKVVSSFLLFVDHEIQRQGITAFQNQSSLFYPDENEIQGFYTYACPYKQLCNDVSISGANIMSGVYLGNSYVSIGQSGLKYINHYDGSVTFDHQIPKNIPISGSFAVKDFSVYVSDQPDYQIVMNDKYHSNPKYAQQATGMNQDEKSMPAVFLVPKDQETKPLAFAGVDDNYMRIRAVVVCENVYQRVAVCGILKNLRLKQMKLVTSTPFDYLGNMTGINYDYTTVPMSDLYYPLITKAKVIEVPQAHSFLDSEKQISMIDFDISSWGTHM